MEFLKRDRNENEGAPQLGLGPLELAVMEVVWRRGEGNVRDVVAQLDRPFAYTTIMTTLDRLFKKGLLERRKVERAFLYKARLSRRELEVQRAGDLVAGFLEAPHGMRELLVCCLVDAVGDRDATILDELERKIQKKRKELERGRQE